MTDITVPTSSRAASAAGTTSSLYRAVWRWHFYAGLFALPFLIILAVTGALYLFRDEIDGLIHADLKRVEAQATAQTAPSAMVAAALNAYPGTAAKYLPPASPDASAEVVVKTTAGPKLSVFVNPYDGRVLGDIPDKGTVMGIVRQIHSLAFFGPIANGLIEIAAGWAILLVATGIYLWWPRGQSGRRGDGSRHAEAPDVVARRPCGHGAVRRLLHPVPGRHRHALVDRLGQIRQRVGQRLQLRLSGRRPRRRSHVGRASGPYRPDDLVAGTGPHAGVGPATAGGGPIGLDAAVAIFDRLGLAKGYAVALPGGPTGVYTGSVYPGRPVAAACRPSRPVFRQAADRHELSPTTGRSAKALEWGINVHMGQEFGLANQLVMLAVCAAIVLMSVSAGVMWWKRRPRGSFGVPPAPSDRRVLRGVVGILAVGGVVFPLVGASLLVMLALDTALTRRKA